MGIFLYTLLIIVLDTVVIILTITYFYIKNSYLQKERQTEIEQKYNTILKQKKEIRKLKRKLFFLKLFN